MGMMNPQETMQPPQAPQGGMMGGAPAAPQGGNPDIAHGKFNGVVDVQGQQVEVKGGVAQADGQPYVVSDSGAMVVNGKGQLVGHVENGKFILVDDTYLNQMRDAGYVK